MTDTLTHYINGASHTGTSTRTSPVFNPATGAVAKNVALASVADVDTAVAAARMAARAAERPKTEWTSRVTSTVRDNGDLTLAAGDRIRHVDFGDGKVTAVTGSGAKSVAEVQFESAGRKRLLIKISPIEKIE